MKIAIVGSGLMGGKLGVHFAQADHQVIFSCARSPQKLARLAERAGSGAISAPIAQAVAEAEAEAEVIFLSIHWSRLDDVLA